MSSISKHAFAICVLTSLVMAAPSGAAFAQRRRIAAKPAPSYSVPHSVFFREVTGRGLLVKTWVNGIGPFTFAIDTGAGATLVSGRIAEQAHVLRSNERSASIAGLSGAPSIAYHASLDSLALGDPENYLPSKGEVLISDGLPPDLDGVLDPTEALSPLGYSIDLPRRELEPFDPRTNPVAMDKMPEEGTVVTWLREPHGRRPFVMLDNGDRALLDTGSSLGLAIRNSASVESDARYTVRDIGGGRITTRRGTASNISIGSLTLRRIPTDFVSGTESDAPVLLGLSALRPFRLRFDPQHRLIEIAANTNSQRP